MPTRRFQRITPAQLLVSGCAFLFGAGVLIEPARAQYVPPPTPLPPPVFNPSNPNTVPQPSYRPIVPIIPSAGPGYVVTSPVSGRRQHTAARPQRGTSVAKTRAAHHHRDRSLTLRRAPESYSYAPFGYGYGCAWWRGWDGYWFRTSPCS